MQLTCILDVDHFDFVSLIICIHAPDFVEQKQTAGTWVDPMVVSSTFTSFGWIRIGLYFCTPCQLKGTKLALS